MTPKRRIRYATIVYDVLSVVAVAIIALDSANVFDFSPEADRYLRGGAAVLGAVLVSDKLDILRDKRRETRSKRIRRILD